MNFFQKYDVAVPRYTSYPTVPYWSSTPTREQWIEQLRTTANAPDSTWSLYVHIPFCETLCTFCGCNNTITKDHDREEPYIDLLAKEWNLYKKHVPELFQKPLRQLHLGGGTPTFLSPKNLKKLITLIYDVTTKDPLHFEGAVEVDPRRTTPEQLQVLREMGFNRISMGVQDFDPEVQRLINRIQPFGQTQSLVNQAREMGFQSINFDLIYGLAKQTPQTIQKTVEDTISLRPDRIALYSLAIVPWIKPAQRLFKDEDLPRAQEKRALYEIAREKLLSHGYREIGMDHFALPKEALSRSMDQGSLHRNFMGYTDVRTDILLGLGVSAISETPGCFHQNEKVMPAYERVLCESEIPTHRGHLLTTEDKDSREQILQFMTKAQASFKDANQYQEAKVFLAEMERDGLVAITPEKLYLTEKGKPFLRNACVFFDSHLKRREPNTRIFSSAI